MAPKYTGTLLFGMVAMWGVMLCVQAQTTYNCTTSTFEGALQECAIQLGIPRERMGKDRNLLLYTADRDSMCLVRCIGVLLRFWNDTTGLREATIRQYYQPAPHDGSYQARTQKCLDTLEPTVTDVCERAHRSFLCYHQQYGHLTEENRYVPKTPLEMRQVQQDCLDVLGLSPKRLVQYQAGHFPDDPETQCFVRCVGLRTGLYSDLHGPNVERLFIQCESCADERMFRDRANECIASERRHKLSKCTAAYRTLYQCFRDDQLDLYAGITTKNVSPPTTSRTTPTSTMRASNALPGYQLKSIEQRYLVKPVQLKLILESLAHNMSYE